MPFPRGAHLRSIVAFESESVLATYNAIVSALVHTLEFGWNFSYWFVTTLPTAVEY